MPEAIYPPGNDHISPEKKELLSGWFYGFPERCDNAFFFFKLTPTSQQFPACGTQQVPALSMMVMAPHWSQMDVSMAPAPVTPMEPHIAPPEPVAEPEGEEVAEVADVEVKPAKKEPPC